MDCSDKSGQKAAEICRPDERKIYQIFQSTLIKVTIPVYTNILHFSIKNVLTWIVR